MKMLTRFLFPLAAALMLACGYASAAVEPADGLLYGYQVCSADQVCLDDVAVAKVAGPEIQLPAMGDHRSTVKRSDMRVASAGLVFKATTKAIERDSTAPS